MAELRQSSKNGLKMLFILASFSWPVLPAFYAAISTPSATPSTCGGRSDQPTEADQARNVWLSGFRASQSADDAKEIGRSPHKVRQTLFKCQTWLKQPHSHF